MSQDLTADQVDAMITQGPYHQWLGLKVTALGEDTIEIRATWREEWKVHPERPYTHGGILATLLDLAADWALVRRTGRGVPTIDMRVDYHSAAMPGDLIVKGRVVKPGSQFSTAEAQVFDLQGKLLASGRATYFTGAVAPKK
ncbi:PaaI family thioesterase [Rhodoplanes sp. TEM]|uniref:PaaI family thioesterase n=1 Tax=Rhodoplanes tepidamans TaxID=200616 RepID=A0ABT5J7A7_RHOTP|nr:MULTISPECIES: PaaI family thioesterase [Rhodoplanes]MDC7785530.1 PaaI family thioesterase [Rhodoplanes tepidamans]MDC7986188.1 PaaI family thioesterase [Rhodoplanes sp. TEM]MDQ0353300.1 uncharacterized protein (TIGR00369 family) [Rhodoplanes tepidamans]